MITCYKYYKDGAADELVDEEPPAVNQPRVNNNVRMFNFNNRD